MMTQNADKKREQVQFLCMDDMVPQDHLLRIIDKAIDWNFIYDLVVEKYSQDNGRPSMDPVMLIKIPFIQYLYGIKSMRQTCKEIEVNVAYRWFLGLDMMDKVPHFSTFGSFHKCGSLFLFASTYCTCDLYRTEHIVRAQRAHEVQWTSAWTDRSGAETHEVRGTSALSRPERSEDRKFESCLSQCIELTSSSWLKHIVRVQTANSPQFP